ncbi:MAG: cell division protein FtsZ [Spirochaetaceae bacterium]|jgi:cell division protein FtsZ|nr:cell division protein FtsZ [Spirochaetaceae bacterium]
MNLEVLDGGLPPRCPTVVKVIGTGGGGSNAVNRMIEHGIKDVDFIAVNTDTQALDKCRAGNKLPIGRKTTQGLGAGGDPEKGKEAAQADEDMIKNCLRDANMVFITAGMGGGTGTGSAPVIAALARQQGALTVGVVTKPFNFEGARRMRLAEEGIEELRKNVDTLIVIPNSNLLNLEDKGVTLQNAFSKADDVLREGIQAISEIITRAGTVNIDFADVKAAMKDQGDALLGIGFGTGDRRAQVAAGEAINNPLYETNSIAGAKHILINVIGGPDITLKEYEEIVNRVTSEADEDADIKPGFVVDTDESTVQAGRIQVTVIATGFPNVSRRQTGCEAEPKKLHSDQLFDYDKVFSGTELEKHYTNPESNLEIPTYLRKGFHLVETGPYETARKHA